MRPSRPAALEDAVNAPYFAGLRNGELLLQHCANCNSVMDYPRLACSSCLSDQLHFRPSSGRGQIYSFTIVYWHYDQSFLEDLPLVVVLVDLEEGVRLMSSLAGVDPTPEAVRIGALVIAEPFVDAAGRAMHRFRLA